MQIVFNGTSGLNNVTDPAHLPVKEGVIVPLTSCVNVSAGDTGRVNRLMGAVVTLPESGTGIHSLTEYKGSFIFVKNSKMYLTNQSGALTLLMALPSNSPVFYETVFTGQEEVLFWVTPESTGRISGSSSLSWSKGDYVGPTTTRKLSEPPKGHICHYALGRMWVATGNDLYCSEPNNPFLFNYFSGRFTFEADISFIAGFENGLWVGTKEGIYWIASDGIQFERKKVSTYGCPKGKPVEVALGEIPLQLSITGTGYIALTDEGFCLLTPGGYFFNLTAKDVTFKDMPAWSSYAGIRYGQYIYTYADNGIGLVLNIRNLALTQQDCYPFNSFAFLNSDVYGASATGIYKLSKTTVTASFTFWLNTQRTGRIRFLHLHGEFVGSLTVTVKNDDEKTLSYIATPRQLTNKQHEFKIPIRRDNGIGTYKEITIANNSGIDFSLDRVEITPITRRLYNAT